MKLTLISRDLLYYFANNNYFKHIKQTRETKMILKKLYEDLSNGFKLINNKKSSLKHNFYNLQIENITHVSQIKMPESFPINAFPDRIRTCIRDNVVSLLLYKIKMFERTIDIYFSIEEDCTRTIINKYNTYVDYMLVWLYIVNLYSSEKCSKHLKIYIYHMNLIKSLPNTNIEVLGEIHINTAFTRTCPIDSEIVVFRKEEWFKSFIHETFHNFALDFSDMDMTKCNETILNIFPVLSEVNLFESYTESWARIINVLFCSYINSTQKNNEEEFLKNVNYFMNIERSFYFFQLTKILNFMGLSYTNLYEKNDISQHLRNTFYKEKTSVLSYYVITIILLNNYNTFLAWCNDNNNKLLQFKKTKTNLKKYCDLIKSNYKTKSLMENIKLTQHVFNNTDNIQNKKDKGLLLKNLRMTLCELN